MISTAGNYRHTAHILATHSPHPGKGLLSDDEWSKVAVVLRLSPRETQVARMVFEGRKRESVARELKLSPRTIRQYMESIHEKLAVRERVGLVLGIVRVRDALINSNGVGAS